MDGEKIQSLNSALRAIHEFVPSQPLINETVRIGVIGFSDTAEVLLQITKMAEVVEFPGLEAKEGTNYGNAFTCLKQTIQTDIAELKSQGYAISERPIVFFVSVYSNIAANIYRSKQWLTVNNITFNIFSIKNLKFEFQSFT